MSTSTDREPCRLCGRQPKIVGGNCWKCSHGGHDTVAAIIYGPNNDPSGTGWDAHMREWDAAYAARAKETEAQDVPDQADAALDKLADGGHVWNGVNPRELRGEPADWWRTGTCGTFPWAIAQLHGGATVRRKEWGKWDYLECRHGVFMYMFKGERESRGIQMDDIKATDWTACPAGVRR